MSIALRPLDIADDAILATSRAQRAADPARTWPEYAIRVVTTGGRFSFDPNNLVGWKVVLVAGPIEVETDGLVYSHYADAVAFQTSLMEQADVERLNAAPFERGLGELLPLTERQEAAEYRAEEIAWESALGREEE